MSKLEKFRKAVEKKDKFTVGFSPIPDWISSGNQSLNEIISGDLRYGWPVSRVSMISGQSGTGKSFLSANAVAQAQKKGFFCIYIDSENSLGDSFMDKIGVDIDEDKFMAVTMYSVEQATEFMSELFKTTEREDKICVIIDSLSNLETEKDMEKFDAGNASYGQGLKQKLYKQLVSSICTRIGDRNMMVLINTHMYEAGSDAYGNAILKPSCGSSTIFLPSVGIEVRKGNLKEGKEQVGIVLRAQSYKTRYTSLGRKCEFDLPWDRGMDEYEGSLPILEREGIVYRAGAWYKYTDPTSKEEVSFQKKNLNEHIDHLLKAYAETKDDGVIERDEDEVNVELAKQE